MGLGLGELVLVHQDTTSREETAASAVSLLDGDLVEKLINIGITGNLAQVLGARLVAFVPAWSITTGDVVLVVGA